MRRELDLLVAAPHLLRGRVQPQVADLEDRRALDRPAPDERAQPRQQLGERERLDQVVVGAPVEARTRSSIASRAVSMMIGAQTPSSRRSAAGLEAVDPGEHHVEDHRVELRRSRHPQRVLACARDVGDEPSAWSPRRMAAAIRASSSTIKTRIAPNDGDEDESELRARNQQPFARAVGSMHASRARAALKPAPGLRSGATRSAVGLAVSRGVHQVELAIEMHVDLAAVGLLHLDLVVALFVADLGGGDLAPTGVLEGGRLGLSSALPVIGVPLPSSPAPVAPAIAAPPAPARRSRRP